MGYPAQNSPLIEVSYMGLTTGVGNVGGTTLVDAALVNFPSFANLAVKLLDGPSAGQVRFISTIVAGTVTVTTAFTNAAGAAQQVAAGVRFALLPASTTVGVPGVLLGQASVPVSIDAIVGVETDFLNLAVANTVYLVQGLILRSVDPNPNAVWVYRRELINGGLTIIDVFIINGGNFAIEFSTMDMFGVPYLMGDRLQLSVLATGGGPYAVTGQYGLARMSV